MLILCELSHFSSKGRCQLIKGGSPDSCICAEAAAPAAAPPSPLPLPILPPL